MSRTSSLAVLAALFCFAPIARAATYVVDASNGPGTDFRRLQAAIDCAVDGDVLLVRRGAYGSIDIQGKALTVIGNGVSTHVSSLQVRDTRFDQRVAVVGLGGEITRPHVFVVRTAGPVVLQDMRILNRILLEDAADVRVRNCEVRADSHPGQELALGVTNSRVELARSIVRGATGPYSAGGGATLRGGRLHCVQSEVYASPGASSNPADGSPALPGGTGMSVILGELIIAGRASIVRGGAGGQDVLNCALSQQGGFAIWNESSTEWSSATLEGGWGMIGPNCTPLQTAPFGGDISVVQVVPPDPVLDVRGIPQADGSIRFTIEGPAGALARAWLGRNATRRVDAGTRIEELTERTFTMELGALPASGSVSFDFHVPKSCSTGTFFCAQAEVELPGSGEIRRTNSTPLVVH